MNDETRKHYNRMLDIGEQETALHLRELNSKIDDLELQLNERKHQFSLYKVKAEQTDALRKELDLYKKPKLDKKDIRLADETHM